MAPFQELCSFKKKKLLVLLLVILISFILFYCSMYISSSTSSSLIQSQKHEFLIGRRLLEVDDDDEDQQPPIIKKNKKVNGTINSSKILKTTNGSPKNQTMVVKSITSSSKNQTKIPKTNKIISSELANIKKNKTKLTKTTSDSAKENQNTIKSQFKKLNSTSKSLSSAKNGTLSNKKSSDLSKTSSEKIKTTTTKKETKSVSDKNIGDDDSDLKNTKSKSPDKKQPSNQKPKSETLPSWIDNDNDNDDDLVSGFNNLPSKFQETLIPDLERISKTSQIYLNKANKEITRNFKPYIGNKYAPIIASSVSLIIIIIPLLFVSLIFNKFKAYFSLQKMLIFIHIYLSIYFSILFLSSLSTGLEPLKFLYATSHSTYVCLMVIQTLGYVLYLLLLLMYFILVFSTDTATPTKFLGLAQIFMGFSVGLHYYMSVFHQAILHLPPKTSWKIHAIYATCFLFICVLTRVDRRKKAYLVDGGDVGKYS